MRPVYVEVLTSPTCSFCPSAVKMVKEVVDSLPDVIAIETSVSTPEGYQKAMSHGISGVPAILINDKVAFVGLPPSLDALRQKIFSASKENDHIIY